MFGGDYITQLQLDMRRRAKAVQLFQRKRKIIHFPYPVGISSLSTVKAHMYGDTQTHSRTVNLAPCTCQRSADCMLPNAVMRGVILKRCS